ncbi:MAG: Trp biosynthesis-associated membrane protein [Glaciihabitans sp.]
MDPRRLRLLTILAIPLVAALTLLSVTQQWWSVDVTGKTLEVLGTEASPSLSALALTSFALTAALAIAGPVFRLVLAALQVLTGVTVLLATFSSLGDPLTTSSSIISEATGVAGSESIAGLVDGVTVTGWPTLAIISGVLTLLLGVLLLFTVRKWPVATKKYQAVRMEEPGAPRTSVGDWDALSDGADPTDAPPRG